MTDAISQVQAAYEPLEDRILLNITTHDKQIYSVWVTRRYLKLLIPALQGKHPRTLQPLMSGKTLEPANSEQPKTKTQSAVFEAYKTPSHGQYPLGEVPIILAKISFKALETNHPMIELNPEKGAGFAIPYDASILELVLKVLEQALQRAAWDLEHDSTLELPEPQSLH